MNEESVHIDPEMIQEFALVLEQIVESCETAEEIGAMHHALILKSVMMVVESGEPLDELEDIMVKKVKGLFSALRVAQSLPNN